MQPKRLLLLAGLLLGVLAVAGYGLLLWLRPSLAIIKPDIKPPIIRDRIPVPSVRFTDITDRSRIRFRHTNSATVKKLLPETMGAGVAFLDYDGDGKQDILFVNSCDWPGAAAKDPKPTLALYRNKGDGTFEDVTAACGLNVTFFGMGVAVGDYDNDGYPDVFVSGVGGHRLFHNDAGKRFTDVTAKAGIAGGNLPDCTREQFLAWQEPIPFGSSATFLDYDGDGRLDLFVCHYVTWSPKIDLSIGATLGGARRAYVQPRDFEGAKCSLYRNVDGQRFEDVSTAAGVQVTEPEGTGPKARQRSVGKSLGVILCDPDEDGWPDLIVANDTVRNFFFHNVAGPDGTRTFVEMGVGCGVAFADAGTARGGMGIDYSEYQPGKSAAVIANFANEPSTFLSLDRPKSLQFSDRALRVGLAGPSRTPLKFGAFFFDFDLDGRLDLLTCNGHIEPEISIFQSGQTFEQPVQLFWNAGEQGRVFEPVTAKEAGEDLFKPMVGRGCAFADIDGDGNLDVVLTANGGPARLLRNEGGTGNHWVRLVLRGDGKRSNVSAIGAQVTVEIGDRTLQRQVTGGRGYLSQSELPLTIGLGKADKVDRVTVRWPGRDAGAPEVWTNLAAGRAHELRQGESSAK